MFRPGGPEHHPAPATVSLLQGYLGLSSRQSQAHCKTSAPLSAVEKCLLVSSCALSVSLSLGWTLEFNHVSEVFQSPSFLPIAQVLHTVFLPYLPFSLSKIVFFYPLSWHVMLCYILFNRCQIRQEKQSKGAHQGSFPPPALFFKLWKILKRLEAVCVLRFNLFPFFLLSGLSPLNILVLPFSTQFVPGNPGGSQVQHLKDITTPCFAI